MIYIGDTVDYYVSGKWLNDDEKIIGYVSMVCPVTFYSHAKSHKDIVEFISGLADSPDDATLILDNFQVLPDCVQLPDESSDD